MLQLAFNWKRLSVIAGVTVWISYFRLYPGTIKSPQIKEHAALNRVMVAPLSVKGTADFLTRIVHQRLEA